VPVLSTLQQELQCVSNRIETLFDEMRDPSCTDFQRSTNRALIEALEKTRYRILGLLPDPGLEAMQLTFNRQLEIYQDVLRRRAKYS
jgi:hypothetical protein